MFFWSVKKNDQKVAINNHRAFISADKYNKGNNASEKMKSYINKLIEINNKTILLPDKKKPDNLKFRLISKSNIHSNISLMNTFVPALAHLQFNTSDDAYKILPNAFKVLVGSKDCKDLINKDPIFASIPSIFDFSEGSYAYNVMKNIETIKDDEDIFRFPINDMANSLCKEIIEFGSNKSNKESYRMKIWEKIEEAYVPYNKPDYSNILDTLIPLFEEYDETISKEHIFFSWDNNRMPDTLEGIESAAHFLKTYQINGKSLFDIIEKKITSFHNEVQHHTEENKISKEEITSLHSEKDDQLLKENTKISEKVIASLRTEVQQLKEKNKISDKEIASLNNERQQLIKKK